MLFVFYGDHTDELRRKTSTLIAGLLKKKPDAAHVVITDENFNPAHLDDFLFGQALFGGSYVVEFANVFSQDGATEAIVERLADMAASANILVVREGPLPAPVKKKLEKHATQIVEVSRPQKPIKAERFNPFVIGDAIYNRSRKDAWIGLMEAKMAGLKDEEIAGSLWFSVKALLSAKNARTPEEVGLSAFPFQKAKRALAKFSEGEIEKMADELIALYHDAHRGEAPMELALERWVLRG